MGWIANHDARIAEVFDGLICPVVFGHISKWQGACDMMDNAMYLCTLAQLMPQPLMLRAGAKRMSLHVVHGIRLQGLIRLHDRCGSLLRLCCCRQTQHSYTNSGFHRVVFLCPLPSQERGITFACYLPGAAPAIIRVALSGCRYFFTAAFTWSNVTARKKSERFWM